MWFKLFSHACTVSFAALLATTAPAIAEEKPDYRACQGFDFFAEFGEEKPESVPVKPGEIGLVACDMILKIPPTRLSLWYNDSAFQQQRAIHLLSLDRDKEALDALDIADKVGSSRVDTLYDGSLAVGSAILRAVALAKTGQNKAALVQLEKVRQARTYNTQIQSLADEVELAISGNLDTYVDRLIQRSQFDPDLMRKALPYFIAAGRYKDALPIIQATSFNDPAAAKEWTSPSWQKPISEAIFNAQSAYINFALGDVEAGQKLLSQKPTLDEVRLNCAKQRPIPGVTLSSQCETAVGFAKRQTAIWETAISLLKEMNDKEANLTDIGKLLGSTADQNFSPILIDLKRNYSKRAGTTGKIDTFFHEGDFKRNFNAIMGYGKLAAKLPSGDSIDRVPKFKKGFEYNALIGENNGLTENIDTEAGQSTIRFTSSWATLSILDDMLLFAIIQKAKLLKAERVLFISRQSIPRFIKTFDRFGRSTTSMLDSFEVSARVAFEGNAKANALIANQSWRAMKISDLEAKISARHLEIMRQKAEYKRPFF